MSGIPGLPAAFAARGHILFYFLTCWACRQAEAGGDFSCGRKCCDVLPAPLEFLKVVVTVYAPLVVDTCGTSSTPVRHPRDFISEGFHGMFIGYFHATSSAMNRDFYVGLS